MSEGKREREREQKRERERERERERRESSKNTLESEPCSPSWRHFLACPKAHWPGADPGARRTAPAPRAPSCSSHRASLRPRALPLYCTFPSCFAPKKISWQYSRTQRKKFQKIPRPGGHGKSLSYKTHTAFQSQLLNTEY